MSGAARPGAAEHVVVPFAVRARTTLPDANAGVEGFLGTTWGSSGGAVQFNLEMALGGGSGVSGTFGLGFALGAVLGKHDANGRRGLGLRGGADLWVDALGPLKVWYLSAPVLVMSYTDANEKRTFDVGLNAAPIVGSLRYGDAARDLGLGLKAGPQLQFTASKVALRVDGGYLLASTAPGGRALWGRGIGCLAAFGMALCTEGSLADFEPPNARPTRAGYIGLVVGLDLASVELPFMPRASSLDESNHGRM